MYINFYFVFVIYRDIVPPRINFNPGAQKTVNGQLLKFINNDRISSLTDSSSKIITKFSASLTAVAFCWD